MASPTPARESQQLAHSDQSSQTASIPQRGRAQTVGSAPASRLQNASLRFLESNPPTGVWVAMGAMASHAPTFADIRAGSFGYDGWTEEGQLQQRGKTPHEIHRRQVLRTKSLPMKAGTQGVLSLDGSVAENAAGPSGESGTAGSDDVTPPQIGPDETGTYPNGYRFPPKRTRMQTLGIALTTFGLFVITPMGFLVTAYAVTIVGWIFMLFLLAVKAAPEMCHPNCDDYRSPRMEWIEIDSQVVNALFSASAFGLIPWRFRDFYYLIRWRVSGSQESLRRLAGIHRNWYRLPESDKVSPEIGPPPQDTTSSLEELESELDQLRRNPALPLPPSSIPPPPLTGVRAPPTRPYLLDAVVTLPVLNTVFQACLSGLMWGIGPDDRPFPAVGVFVVLMIFTGLSPGVLAFVEGRRIKKVEGVPVDNPLQDEEAGRERPEENRKTKHEAANGEGGVVAN